jgi:hypothetical protein
VDAPHHVLNWYAGWWLLLAAFATGAAVGLFFHDDAFLGGYASFRRRLLRLGHIALAALGMLNLLYAVSPWPAPSAWQAAAASWCFVLGGVAMPLVCFLSAWHKPLRHLFFVPVAALTAAVVLTLSAGA